MLLSQKAISQLCGQGQLHLPSWSDLTNIFLEECSRVLVDKFRVVVTAHNETSLERQGRIGQRSHNHATCWLSYSARPGQDSHARPFGNQVKSLLRVNDPMGLPKLDS